MFSETVTPLPSTAHTVFISTDQSGDNSLPLSNLAEGSELSVEFGLTDGEGMVEIYFTSADIVTPGLPGECAMNGIANQAVYCSLIVPKVLYNL